MDTPPPEEAARIARALRTEPLAWREVTRRGQTNASHWLVELPDGGRAFVKSARGDDTASWIRDEHLFYAQMRGAPFLPRMLGWHDDGERPVLVLEDLSGERWPPPWDRDRIELVRGCLAEVSAATPPPDLPQAVDSQFDFQGWIEIEDDPEPFLGLGLCSRGWLEAALPTLRFATEIAPLDGSALLHFDVRSDNICLKNDRAILVDWNFACLGNPLADVAFWLPSVHAEGGPPPDEILPEGAGELAALIAGYFAAHAARPEIPEAPHVRSLQLRQARTALPWAARALDLPPPA
jgi:Ser/Thr protein kinase RdoA (MazF antagonist)